MRAARGARLFATSPDSVVMNRYQLSILTGWAPCHDLAQRFRRLRRSFDVLGKSLERLL